MSTALTSETFYTRWKSVIDPAAFIGMGLIGFGKLRAVEWIREPVMQQEMVLSGVVNGLTVGLSHHIGNGDQSPSILYKSVLTLIGFAVGVIIVPFVASKIMQNRVALITTESAFRVTAFNLLTKVFVSAFFTLGESYYNTRNFPIFQNFDEMTPSTIGIFYDHFKSRRLLWNKVSFQKQLEFNRLLLKHDVPPLNVTNIDLDAHLTRNQLKTFRQLFEKKKLTSKQATILYKFHVSPEQREYKLEELPFIYPRRVDVKTLSDQQLKWHYIWIRAHNQLLPQSQIQAFVPHFFRLNLFPPHEKFVAELPHFPKIKTLTPPQVSYLAFFYKGNVKRWGELSLKDQVDLKKLFRKHGLDAHTLRLPTIEEIPQLTVVQLQDYHDRFTSDRTVWDVKGERYQKAFNQKLKKHKLTELALPAAPWLTVKKVSLIAGIIIVAASVGFLGAYTRLSLADRSVDPMNQECHELTQTMDKPALTIQKKAFQVMVISIPKSFYPDSHFHLNTTHHEEAQLLEEPNTQKPLVGKELALVDPNSSPVEKVYRALPRRSFNQLPISTDLGGCKRAVERLWYQNIEHAGCGPILYGQEGGEIYSALQSKALVESEKQVALHPLFGAVEVEEVPGQVNGCEREWRFLTRRLKQSHYSPTLYVGIDGAVYPTQEQAIPFNPFVVNEQPVCDAPLDPPTAKEQGFLKRWIYGQLLTLETFSELS